MRVAFADMLFSWPPNGGADTDLFHVMKGLQSAGVHVQLFYAQVEAADDRGIVQAESLPFPSQAVYFEKNAWRPEEVARRYRNAIEAFAPQAVFATHGFAMKPALLQALASYPLASRYFAHELTCAKDPRRFRDGAPCPYDYLRTPEICRNCAADAQRHPLLQHPRPAWTVDYLAAKAYAPDYHKLVLDSLRLPRTLIVYNEFLREELTNYHPDIRVVPGGANIIPLTLASPPLSPSPPSSGGEGRGEGGAPTQKPDRPPTTILMAGRADDPLKGLATLSGAGRLLWQHRQDFRILATHYDHTIQTPWLHIIGWLGHAETSALYQQADIVAIPSIWHEPFGLVAVEAMAASRPVVASRSGGLSDIVRDGDTGLLVPPNDATALARALETLLDNPRLREQMGRRGREVAEEEYDWARIIERHYLPLLEDLVR